MPVYNAENFLEESVNSILNQTFKDFELLLLEDGSKDSSLALANKLAEKDSRIKVVPSEVNLGIVKTLNRGIEISRGEYLARMDADDISLPERFMEQVQYLDANKDIAVCGTWVETFGNHNGNIWRLPSDPDTVKVTMLFYGVLCHPSVMIRKEMVFDKLKLRYEGYHAEDYVLWVSVAKHAKLVNIPKVLIKYRTHDSSLMSTFGKENLEVADNVRKMQLKEIGIDPSDDEFLIHKTITSWNFQNSSKYIIEVRNWFLKILNANKNTSYYNQEALALFLNEKLIEIYKQIDIKFTKGIITFFFLSLINNLEFKTRLKFFFRWNKTFIDKLIK